METDLLESALRAFALKGYDGVSMRELTRELGISSSLLHHHYGSKRGLWNVCIDHIFGKMVQEAVSFVATIRVDNTVEQSVRFLIVEYLKLTAKFPDVTAILVNEGAIGGDRNDYIFDRHIRRFVEPAMILFQQAVDQGRFFPIPFYSLLYTVTIGAPSVFLMTPAVKKLGIPAPLDPEEVERHAQAVADVVIRGLLRPKAT